MKCNNCISKYKCKRMYKNTSVAEYTCNNYKRIKDRTRSPFNSNKFARNPRERGYMLLKRKTTGVIEALADTGMINTSWNKACGILWHNYIDAEFYLHECKKWKDYDPCEEVFIARVNTKNCPVSVDFKLKAPRCTCGNVSFTEKKMIKSMTAYEYLTSIIRE